MVLAAEPRDPTSPKARALAAAWNHVHSIPSRIGGLQFAVLLDVPPPDAFSESDGPAALVWLVPHANEYAVKVARIGYEQFAAITSRVAIAEVLLAEPEVPRALLERIGFAREICPTQVTGFWFDRRERLPSEEPGYFPSVAVVPRMGQTLTSAPCVFAIAVDWVWYPLSEVAVYTYSHASDLVGGRDGIFVRQGGPWPRHDRAAPESVFRMKHAGFVQAQSVEREYGAPVVKRARSGAPLMLVELAPSDAKPK